MAGDEVVVLGLPLRIKAGDLIGHLGPYQESNETTPQHKLHLEVFTGDDVNAFFKASRLWAERLPATQRTWLKFAKGTPVVAHKVGFCATRLPNVFGEHTPSGADLQVPRSLLDALPADRKIQVPKQDHGKAYNWYHLDGLLNDADGNLLDGWVREEVGVTPWVSPWAWDGFDIIYNNDPPQHGLAYFLQASGLLGEEERERCRPMADQSDKGPVRSRLFDIIDRNRDGRMTADELQAALRIPAHAQSIARLVIHYESEWYYRQPKWDALDKVLGHTTSAPMLNWVAEKERIKQLSWWEAVAGRVGLPWDGQVYHLHPVGLMENFYRSRFAFTLDIMKKLYPLLDSGRHSDLQEIANELNRNIDFYKLDTPLRRTHFFAQILQETGAKLAIEEDLTYGANALINVFGYFKKNPNKAVEHGYKIRNGRIKENGIPMGQADFEVIANGAYGDRAELGNRGITSGDGWKYRGRGLKQLTGLYNYTEFHKWHQRNSAQWPSEELNFIENPDLLATMKYATRSAASFWLNNKLYEIADMGSDLEVVNLITNIVNFNTKSRQEREENFSVLWEAEILQ
ncbi:hypothetical protein D9M70_435000 [compost metagenome]